MKIMICCLNTSGMHQMEKVNIMFHQIQKLKDLEDIFFVCLFACFGLCWVFVALHGLSQVWGVEKQGYSSCGVQTSHRSGFSC